MKKIVIAGANSFVASHFVHELLGRGYHVVALVRGSSGQSAPERMQQALLDTTLDLPVNEKNLTVFNYALLDEGFGISENDLAWIFEDEVDYFHFAASLKFDFQSKEEIFETNIDGLHNAMRVFDQHAEHGGRFFFISTAYSCGIFPGIFKEKFYPNEDISAFRNYYEQSKRKAENVLGQYIEQSGFDAHIVRLAQVVGHSKTGVTRTDYGIFDFARKIYSLAVEYPDQKIRILADPESNQNLISIDTVVNDLIAMIEVKNVPVILNFVASHPLENETIIRTISELLPIELIPIKDIEVEEMNALEKMVLSGMTFTGNYIDTDIHFETCARDKIISENHREVNESSLYSMLQYYLKHLPV